MHVPTILADALILVAAAAVSAVLFMLLLACVMIVFRALMDVRRSARRQRSLPARRPSPRQREAPGVIRPHSRPHGHG